MPGIILAKFGGNLASVFHGISLKSMSLLLRDIKSVHFLEDSLYPGLKLRVRTKKLIFLFLNQNTCCGYSKEPSQWDGSFEHPKHMLKLMGKKIFTILR